MIKNIVFDIGNVLADFVWEEFFQSFGYDEAMVKKIAEATVKQESWNEFDKGEVSEETIIQAFIEYDPSIEKELREVFANIKGMVRRNNYAIPWIKELKEKGYGVYIISNFSEKGFRDCADALDFMEYVDGSIISYREKLTKPDSAIYQLLLNRYELNASECVFIDDLQKNVDAARNNGMQGIQFKSLQQVKEELKELGVE